MPLNPTNHKIVSTLPCISSYPSLSFRFFGMLQGVHDITGITANLMFHNRLIGLVGRVFANGLGNRGSIPVRVIPKTIKMVLDISLLNTQHYKVRIKGKVEQSKERSSALSYPSVL